MSRSRTLSSWLSRCTVSQTAARRCGSSSGAALAAMAPCGGEPRANDSRDCMHTKALVTAPFKYHAPGRRPPSPLHPTTPEPSRAGLEFLCPTSLHAQLALNLRHSCPAPPPGCSCPLPPSALDLQVSAAGPMQAGAVFYLCLEGPGVAAAYRVLPGSRIDCVERTCRVGDIGCRMQPPGNGQREVLLARAVLGDRKGRWTRWSAASGRKGCPLFMAVANGSVNFATCWVALKSHEMITQAKRHRGTTGGGMAVNTGS